MVGRGVTSPTPVRVDHPTRSDHDCMISAEWAGRRNHDCMISGGWAGERREGQAAPRVISRNGR